jgi:endonuclease/exonuclease/phosphatase family metal-dependent hydrolase
MSLTLVAHGPRREAGKKGSRGTYHCFFGERQGEESRPTTYFQWNRDRPYHIDYCFISESWMSRLNSMEVGTFEDWSDISDHRPLTVDVALPTPSPSLDGHGWARVAQIYER